MWQRVVVPLTRLSRQMYLKDTIGTLCASNSTHMLSFTACMHRFINTRDLCLNLALTLG